MTRLRVLWLATKPPWPPVDGGRLVAAATIDALATAGADITIVAPRAGQAQADGPAPVQTVLVDTQPRDWPSAAWRSLRSGRPVSIERHAHAPIISRVADLIARARFDVVHVEQLQALAGAAPARDAGIACVLRAQNVESAVWRAAGPLTRLEAWRLRRFEATALAAVDATITLSPTDALRLSALTPPALVVTIPPPMATRHLSIPPAKEGVLAGDPAFTWIGSPGWPPNDDALAWLLGEVWPALSARLPEARLHLFAHAGNSRRMTHAIAATPRVMPHPAPENSGAAFDAASILLLPLRTAAGVRMRLLEAWARGVPAIASPAAVDGLDAADGRDVLIASTPRAFAEAGARLAAQPDLRARLIGGGRATLARHHDPSTIARAILAVYEDAIRAAAAR